MLTFLYCLKFKILHAENSYQSQQWFRDKIQSLLKLVHLVTVSNLPTLTTRCVMEKFGCEDSYKSLKLKTSCDGIGHHLLISVDWCRGDEAEIGTLVWVYFKISCDHEMTKSLKLKRSCDCIGHHLLISVNWCRGDEVEIGTLVCDLMWPRNDHFFVHT